MLYMNQKTYNELSDEILMTQPPKFLPVLVEQIDPSFGCLGLHFLVDDNIPDKTIHLLATQGFRSDNLEKIQCRLESFIPDLRVI